MSKSNGSDSLTDSRNRPPRLLDVAHKAKVSRATAARALGGYGLVGAKTREKVLAAARALDYRTNEVARSMRSGRTLTIGVVVADIANSFFSGVVRAIIETAGASGYQVLVLNTDDRLDREIDALKVLREKRVDGLIVVPSSPTRFDHLLATQDSTPPMVLLDRRIPESGLGAVTTDDYRGARQAIELFVERGHSRIGLLVSTVGVPSYSATFPYEAVSTVHERYNGAVDAMRHFGLEPDAAWIRFSQPDLENAVAAAREILLGRPRPTAILATNEEMALGILSACHERGVAIGRDVSLVSVDDATWSSVHAPSISVIRRPVYEMGREAVSLLFNRMGNAGFCSTLLPTQLIDRCSVFDFADE